MTNAMYPTLRTPLCDLLGCDVPILLAGMGGVSCWELAAAVACAGGYPQPHDIALDVILTHAGEQMIREAK